VPNTKQKQVMMLPPNWKNGKRWIIYMYIYIFIFVGVDENVRKPTSLRYIPLRRVTTLVMVVFIAVVIFGFFACFVY